MHGLRFQAQAKRIEVAPVICNSLPTSLRKYQGALVSTSLPLSLLFAWCLYFGFVNTHQRHASAFKGASQGFHAALNLSVILGSITGLALLVYYFMQVAWYWPILLFIGGSLIAGLIFGVLDKIVGQPAMSLLGFLAWPAAAIWAFFIIHGLGA